MTSKSAESAPLRQRAEEKFSADGAPLEALAPEEIQQLLHELKVHQIELEMQNDELRRTQQELEAARARYFDLYDLAPVGYLTLSEKGVVQEANLTVADMFGVRRISLLKQAFSRFIISEDQDIYYLHRKQLFETHSTGSGQVGEPQVCELRLVKGDGTLFWAHMTATLAHTADGSSECRLVLSDISDLKRVMEEKTAIEAQLAQARKIEAVGLLAGGIAHDFNNMLTVILGHVELALKRLDSSQPFYEDFRVIGKAADRSAKLTRQMLAFARKQMIAPEVLNLNETVTGMLAMLERMIGENIRLDFQPGAELWPVRVDPSQIDQIMANLCINARSAIAYDGQISVSTENIRLDESWSAAHPGGVPGEYVRITLRDTGCGMEQETLEHIFEPFFTTRGVGEGTGMGLATVYGIVKQNSGFIEVESRPGEGATFTIYLPRCNGAVRKEQSEASANAALKGGETILLVEDEPVILEMVGQMLEMLGYGVFMAGSPNEALRLAKEHDKRIDLLFTDVMMPVMSGKDLSLKLCSFNPELKCLYMSGYTADIIAEKGELKKSDHFIQKPFNLQALTGTLREILDG